MKGQAPKVDRRTAADVERQLHQLLGVYTARWPQFDPRRGLSAALVGVFRRYAEIIIERLNKVPEKNFLAFLDLLGASLLTPQPARVPLTFSLAAGTLVDAVVPAGTQAAAPPAEGEKEPVIFETERELVVTAARLDAVYVRDPERDRYADISEIADPSAASQGVPIFEGTRQTEHVFYLGHDVLLSYPAMREVHLTFTLNRPPANAAPRALRWEVWDGTDGTPVTPATDTTAGLTKDGDIVFSNLAAVPRATVQNVRSRWLRCRLLTPVTNMKGPAGGMLTDTDLPLVQTAFMRVALNRTGLPVEAAFTNTVPVDLSKDFFPLGERPRYGDVFYLANGETFARPGASVGLNVTLVNPASLGAASPIPATRASANLSLLWEYWDGRSWKNLVTALPAQSNASDTTRALTESGRVSFVLPNDAAAANVNGVDNAWLRVRVASGNYGEDTHYELNDPNDPSKGYRLNDPNDISKGYRVAPANFAPPSIKGLTVDYSWASVPHPPDAAVTYNDYAYQTFARAPFKPFRAMGDASPALYFGFSLPAARPHFPNRKLSLYAGTVEARYGEVFVPVSPRRSVGVAKPGEEVTHSLTVTNTARAQTTFDLAVTGNRWGAAKGPAVTLGPDQSGTIRVTVRVPGTALPDQSDRAFVQVVAGGAVVESGSATLVTAAGDVKPAPERVRLEWEYWNGVEWAGLLVRDDTANFTLAGLVEFLAPADFVRREEVGRDLYWIRARWRAGQYEAGPRLRRALLNTVMAAQTVSIFDEVLGSSDAGKSQRFAATRKPVLSGERLEVREPEEPSWAERETILKEGGGDAVRVVRDDTGRPVETWVRWLNVPDFYGSGPRDRHYVLDRLTGEIRFGDGLNGLIPPRGAGNLRLARYRTGGGAGGNRAAGTVTQLKTTVPYIDEVTNVEPAAGGADAEARESLVERAPRTIRHRDRAVTLEDYEDLARLASPDIARAKCVPLYDLAADGGEEIRLGTVSVIVVPRSGGAKPQPTLELINRARDFLAARRVPTGDVVVVGPEYVRVDVEATVGVASLEGAGEVEAEVLRTLARYLHPLTGGLDNRGWDFGRRPHRSDLFALLESVAGVDYVHTLNVVEAEERAGAGATDRFLVYSGRHRIGLTFGAD